MSGPEWLQLLLGAADAAPEPPDPVEEIRAWAKFVDEIPKPRFDRIAARNLEPFREIPAGKRGLRQRAFLPSLGVPVFVDETVEAGVLELRLGDEVVERVRIS